MSRQPRFVALLLVCALTGAAAGEEMVKRPRRIERAATEGDDGGARRTRLGLENGTRRRGADLGRSRRERLADPTWLHGATERASEGLFRNLSPEGSARGAVVAAPSENPDYRFHWVRDAALVMGEVLDRIDRKSGKERGELVDRYQDYVRFSARLIATKTQTGNGEPKYNLDGSAFDGPWGRPQNDGPATRALGNLRFARQRLDDGEDGERFVRGEMFGKDGGIIRSDLEYLIKEWREPSFDIWEEEKGDQLYTRLVAERALARGAELAYRLGDDEAGDRYAQVARDVAQTFDAHWDGARGILLASLARGHRAGVDYKASGLDAAVLLGVLHTAEQGGPLRPSDDRVLATAHALESAFRDSYPINQGRKGAVFIGRYPEDDYCGRSGCTGKGNPWILTTRAMGELHFRAAAELAEKDVTITPENRGFFVAALGEGKLAGKLAEGTTLPTGSLEHRALMRALVSRGDEYLALIREVVPDGALETEQIDKTSGKLVGAQDLTWNHAALLSAVRARGEARSAMRREARSTSNRRHGIAARARVRRAERTAAHELSSSRLALPEDAPELEALRQRHGWKPEDTRVIEAELVYTTDGWKTTRRSQLGEAAGRAGKDFVLEGVPAGQALQFAVRVELGRVGADGKVADRDQTWINNESKNLEGTSR